MYLVTADEMREMDRRTIEEFGLPGQVLMETAGRGATAFLLEQFPDIARLRVGIVAGRGNNGGDGCVIARCLAHRDISVTVYLLSASGRVTGDAAANLKRLHPLGVPVIEIPDADAFRRQMPGMREQDLWVDAILGTGLRSEVRGFFKDVIDFLNSLRSPIFAVDIPSGLNSDTGQACGCCIQARATATFAFAKTGHFIHPGTQCTGRLQVVDIGIPPHIADAVNPKQHLLTPSQVRAGFPARPADAHKGRTGHLLAIAGSPGKTGAAAMTAMAALRSGAGLVTLGVAEQLNPVLEALALEAMTEPLPATAPGVLGENAFPAIVTLLAGKSCLAVGPGLGQAEDTRRLLLRLIAASEVPVVIDADGINNLAGHTDALKQCRAPVILTPHPGEMARLAGTTTAAVQSDRIAQARAFAVGHGVHLVLKGANTVVAHPDGTVFINATGNAGMASGGMGDVLTGMVAGFLAQGFSPESATHAGVYLHGAAADTLAQTVGPFGYLASEVMHRIPGEIQRLKNAGNNHKFS